MKTAPIKPTFCLVASVLIVGVLLLEPVHAATINFNTRAGKKYTVESSFDLQTWAQVGNSLVADGNSAKISVPSASAWSFYRVRLEPDLTFNRLSFNAHADLDELKTGFSNTSWKVAAKEVLRRAVPDAGWIVDNDTDPNFFYFWFGGDMADFTQMLFRLSAAAHETIHHVGFERITFQNGVFVYSLVLGNNEFFSTPAMSLFPRSEILNSLPDDMRTLGYASTYLTGQSGTQDIVNLLDEFNAYTFTALIDTALLPYLTGLSSCSSRDGVLAMMLFTEEYLRVARERYPNDYGKILNSPLVDFILILWDRAEQTLKMSEGEPRLGQQDQAIRAYVYNPDHLGEIQRLRAAVFPRISITR